jgi:hypothetical protein
MAGEELTVISGKRKILWDPEPEPQPAPPPPPKPIQLVTKPKQEEPLAVQPKRTYKQRIGNGHKSTKVRDLYDPERDSMRHNLFLPKNGQISDDDCVDFKPQLASEVGIFQITGFISVLHTEVAEGRTQVKDLVAYENWMRTKYGGTLWARYNNPLYVDARKKNNNLIAQGLKPVHKVTKDQAIQVSLTPKFTVFGSRKKYAGA